MTGLNTKTGRVGRKALGGLTLLGGVVVLAGAAAVVSGTTGETGKVADSVADRIQPGAASQNVTRGAYVPTWGSAGSMGVPDEASVAKLVYSQSTAEMRSNASGSATIRYNVTAAEGLGSSLSGGIVLAMRYRDNGSGARVRAILRRTDIVTGAMTTVASLDSNNFASSSSYKLAEIDKCNVVMDFYNYLYYIEVIMEKSSGSGKPAIQGVQVVDLVCP